VDHAIAICREPAVAIASYGDLLRVPGSSSSLERERASGRDVRVVYSALDALAMAASEPRTLVVFLGVGFETTAPTAAAAIVEAAARGLDNFAVLGAHRLVPPALEALLADPALRVDAFLAPGHVSAIIGLEPYRFVAERHRRPVVVAGFEPEEMLLGIEALLRQVGDGRAEVENAYGAVVRPAGNPRARALLDRVLEPCGSRWRGIGEIPASGLAIRDELARHDAAKRVVVEVEEPSEPAGCRCGEVLKGVISPEECGLFAERCAPETPVGACMVSSEGSCAAAYRYGRGG
jgi:hydrogenase expression/formation protein HypD